MNDANHKETGFDELDAALAAALGDASAWPAPRAGFEERCVARMEGILKGNKMRRPFWSFGRAAFLKLAASLAVLLGVYAFVFYELADSGPQVSVRILFQGRHRIPMRTHSEISGKERIARGCYEVLGEGVYGGRYMM